MTKKLLTIAILSLAAQAAFCAAQSDCDSIYLIEKNLQTTESNLKYLSTDSEKKSYAMLRSAGAYEKDVAFNEGEIKTLTTALVVAKEQCNLFNIAEEHRLSLPNPKIGMNAKQVIDGTKWGKPDRINRTITATRVHEQWVYSDNSYLYFENGKLTAIQN